MEDALAAGGAGVRFLNLRGASTVEGGLPIIAGGKVIGGIGVSGVTSQQDGMVAKAGADARKYACAGQSATARKPRAVLPGCDLNAST